MESITNTLQEVLPTLEDWKAGVLTFMQNGISKEADNLPALIAIIVFSLLTCFFGLKMIRLWSALIGLLIGLMAGYTVGLICGLEVVPALLAGAAAGVVLAALSGALMSFGIFIFVLTAGAYLGISILNPQSWLTAGICAAIGLILATLAMKFKKSLTIIFTAAAGGLASGFAIVQVAGLNRTFMPYIIAVVLIALGIIVQFFDVSKKANKKILEKAEKIKQEVSVENDIEAAKSILDQIDAEPEEIKEPEAPEADPVQDFDDLVVSEDDFEDDEAAEDVTEETEEAAEEDPQKKLEEAMRELERVKKELEDAKKAKENSKE